MEFLNHVSCFLNNCMVNSARWKFNGTSISICINENLYNMLFYNLIHLQKKMENCLMKTIIEFEQTNAINNYFPFAIHLVCFFHLQQLIYRRFKYLVWLQNIKMCSNLIYELIKLQV